MRAAPMIRLIALLCVSATLAGQTSEQDWKSCVSSDSATRIAGCTALIEANKEPKEGLATAFMNRGTAYTTKGDYDRAIEDFDQSVRLNSNDANAFYNRGYAYYRKGEYDHAIENYDQSLRLNPNFSIALANRGNAYDDKGDPARAIRDYDDAIRLDAKNMKNFIDRGIAYGHEGNYDRAIQDFDQALRLNPTSAFALANRSFAYYRKKDYDRAIKDDDQAIKFDPNDQYAFDNRGNAYSEKNDFDHAIQDYDQALRLDPKGIGFWMDRGLAYERKGDADHAIADFSQAVGLNSKDPSIYVSRAIAYAQKGDSDHAIQDYDQSLQLNPDYTDALIGRGSVYGEKGDYDRAIEDLNRALLLNPKSADALADRGDAYLGKMQDERAIQDYDQALALSPNNTEVLNGRSQAYFDLGRFATAVTDLSAAAKLDPSYPYYPLWLYVSRVRAGQDGRAELEKNSRQAKLAEWPGPVFNLFLGKTTPEAILSAANNSNAKKDREQHCEAYFYLGEYALMKGNTAEARRFFQQSVDTGVTGFVEHAEAQAELKHVPGGPEVAEVKRGLVADPVVPVPVLQNGKYYALVIGINQYRLPMPALKTAVSDAQAVAKDLRDIYGFEVKLLLDGAATRTNILSAIVEYRNNLGPNDSLLIYYAGHGYSDKEAEKAYWLPVDADSNWSPNAISADDLTSGVRVQAARHVLIISDSCYSGDLSRDASVVPRSTEQQAYQRYLARMLSSRSRTIMASGGDEPVSDGGSDGHSVFAYELLQSLEHADEGMFTAGDLFSIHLKQRVGGNSQQQPRYDIIRASGHEEGDFVFVRKVGAGQVQ
jgi:tetratricopeptide (TPR) repeat protein